MFSVHALPLLNVCLDCGMRRRRWMFLIVHSAAAVVSLFFSQSNCSIPVLVSLDHFWSKLQSPLFSTCSTLQPLQTHREQWPTHHEKSLLSENSLKSFQHIIIKMPRQNRGRPAPAPSRAPSRPTAAPAARPAAPQQQQTRPASTAAYPPQAQHQAPPAAPQASQGPGLFGQMASTAA